MITARIKNITSVANTFSGKDGEPSNDIEFYILKSLWVMMVSEFEGSIKDLAESYIDKVNLSKKDKIHICILIQNFHPNSEENLTITKILSLYKKKPKINYTHFTRNKKPKYKAHSVEKLFNTLGIFFSDKQLTSLKLLDGIASTRDAIAHGDTQIQITKKELENRILDIKTIYKMIKRKLPK